MTNQDVDDYLAGVPEPQKSTLESLRAMLTALLPDGEQGIAYGVPCFKVGGKGVAGFGFYKNHCTYFPMSGSITAELADDLHGVRHREGVDPVPERRAAAAPARRAAGGGPRDAARSRPEPGARTSGARGVQAPDRNAVAPEPGHDTVTR